MYFPTYFELHLKFLMSSYICPAEHSSAGSDQQPCLHQQRVPHLPKSGLYWGKLLPSRVPVSAASHWCQVSLHAGRAAQFSSIHSVGIQWFRMLECLDSLLYLLHHFQVLVLVLTGSILLCFFILSNLVNMPLVSLWHAVYNTIIMESPLHMSADIARIEDLYRRFDLVRCAILNILFNIF